MASSGKKKFLLGPLIDSDDSDQECTQGKTIEDLKYEIDVARFYKTLVNEKLFSRNSEKTSRKSKQISKAVQTDPDTSSIPPSWLYFSQQLASELYTGLANMINTIYHTPNGYCKGDAGKVMLDPPDMKFFKYESGYWQSKLLPQVKIPATVGLNKQIQSESFKNELYSLLEKATKLQNAFPYVVMEEGEDRIITEDEINASKNKFWSRSQSEVMAKNTVEKGACCSQEDVSSCTVFSEKSDTDSLVSGPSMRSRANVRKLATNNNTQKKSNHVVANRSNVKFRDLKPIPGIFVSKCNLPHQESKGVEISVPKQHASKKLFRQGVDTAPVAARDNRNGIIIIGGKVNRPSSPVGKVTASHVPNHCADNAPVNKDTNREVENACNSNREKRNNEKNLNGPCKTECSSSNDGKNFIKRNILASKFPAHRSATTSKATQSAVFPRNGAAQR